MSNGRRAARPVRQLSLQQPVPRRQHIRRQRSAEDDCGKSLQIYANPIARGRLAANATEKPKVRVAWSDDRRGSNNAAQVEVVARQIPSRSRPTTGRSGRPYVAMEKASILYSRQELAERLRLAWKHREQKKANIDIFLAHGVTVGDRCESEMSMSAPPTPLSGKKSDSVQNDEEDTQNPETSGDMGSKKTSETDNEDGCEKSEVASPTTENDLSTKKDEDVAESVEKEEGANEEGATTSHANSDPEEKKKTRINIDCTNLHLSTTSVAFPSLKPESARPSDNFTSAKQKRASFHSGTNRAFLIPMTEKSPKTCEAKDRIASTKLVEMRCASADKTTATRSDKGAVFARSSSTASLDKTTRRTSSAPLQKRNVASATRVQVNIVIDAPGLGEMTQDKSLVCGKTQDGKDATEKNEEAPTKILRGERPIRSAPLKRRSKSTKKRALGSSDPSRDEDRGGRGGKGPVDPRTSDVITMVSLVSSADSDSDVEKLPGDDKLIDELRSKLPTTPIIKTSLSTNPGTARKPIKSVSFQRDSFDEEPTTREERQTVGVQPSRFGFAVTVAHRNEDSEQKPAAVGIAATTTTTTTTTTMTTTTTTPPLPPPPPPLPISALIVAQNAEEETPMPEAPLTDREKRCLAVPIGDLHDKKRKLLRTRSTPSRPITETEPITNVTSTETKEPRRRPHLTLSRIDLVVVPAPPTNDELPLPKIERFAKDTPPSKEETPRGEAMPSEPHFQTIKEKECWHLYRRMCDKGVCVSFDTVLRGMLTPTEYRLRQKELSQDLP